jgi:hypothetical protein
LAALESFTICEIMFWRAVLGWLARAVSAMLRFLASSASSAASGGDPLRGGEAVAGGGEVESARDA